MGGRVRATSAQFDEGAGDEDKGCVYDVVEEDLYHFELKLYHYHCQLEELLRCCRRRSHLTSKWRLIEINVCCLPELHESTNDKDNRYPQYYLSPKAESSDMCLVYPSNGGRDTGPVDYTFLPVLGKRP